ncbi:unnamed protein product [Malus baccata var. baccata]
MKKLLIRWKRGGCFMFFLIIGCFAGHPAEVIVALTEEIRQLTSMVAEFMIFVPSNRVFLHVIYGYFVSPMVNTVNTITVQSSAGFSDHYATLNIISEGMPLVEALMIVTCSLHNCRVFGYHGGIQKLTALMKGISSITLLV